MKLPLRILAAGLCLALAACEGLALTVTPDGRVAATYTYTPPPPKAVVTSDKGSK